MNVTKEKLIARLRAEVDEHGVRGYASRIGVSPAYVSDVLLGRRDIGPKILSALGVERVVQRVVIYTEPSK